MLIKILILIIFFSFLIPIFIIDLKKQIIPDYLSYSLIIVGLLINFFIKADLLNIFLAITLSFAIFYLINFFAKLHYKKDALGGGDAKLIAGIGAFLGLKAVLIIIYLSFILGGVAGLILVLFKRKKKESYVAFGPIIIIATCLFLLIHR